jgi:hypothetical protein
MFGLSGLLYEVVLLVSMDYCIAVKISNRLSGFDAVTCRTL